MSLDSLSCPEIQDNFLFFRRLLQKLLGEMLDGVHPEPITAVDEWGSALGFLDEIPEEMWLGVVKPFDTALGNDTAVVGL